MRGKSASAKTVLTAMPVTHAISARRRVAPPRVTSSPGGTVVVISPLSPCRYSWRHRRRSWRFGVRSRTLTRCLRRVDLDRVRDTVSLLPRHVRRRVRRVRARLVRGVNRPFEDVTERRCLALLDAFEDDLIRLHDVVDVEPQVPYSSMAER